MDSLLDYIAVDSGLTTDQYAADIAVRIRLNTLPPGMPTTRQELERWLTALEDAGQVVCADGQWHVCLDREPVGVQGSLFE